MSRAAAQASIYRLFAIIHTEPLQSTLLVLESGAWLSGLDAAVLKGTALFRGSQSTALNVAITHRNVEMINILVSADADARAAKLKNANDQMAFLSSMATVFQYFGWVLG